MIVRTPGLTKRDVYTDLEKVRIFAQGVRAEMVGQEGSSERDALENAREMVRWASSAMVRIEERLEAADEIVPTVLHLLDLEDDDDDG